MNEDFKKGFLKSASDKPSWWEREKGVVRATTTSENGLVGIKRPDFMDAQVEEAVKGGKKGLALGGLGGLALGALRGRSVGNIAGAGVAGSLLGGLIGSSVGQYKGESKYLKDKGIKKKLLGLSHEFDEDARKKFIDPYQKK